MKQNTIPQPTIETVKEALLSLGEVLEEAEAIGIFGSLARGTLSPRSDIDVFVVVREKDPHGEDDMRWWLRIQRVLEPFQRDVTVLVYTVRGLKQISNWYVLRLASEGVIVYDRGGITQLFQQIISAAERAGLVQKRIGDTWVWAIPHLKPGEVVEIKVA